MASGTRGKLKEKFEGVHSNQEWSKRHLAAALVLIQDHNPALSGAIKSLAEGIETLDKLAQDIYARL